MTSNSAGPRMSAGERLHRRVRGAVRRALVPVWPREGEAWDRRAGVTTEAPAALAGLTVLRPPSEGHHYVATPPRLLKVWLDPMPDRVLRDCTFVDMGSGRGRMLLMASERPFRRVIGVEFARELHDAAERNIARFPRERMRCTDVRSVYADAAGFEFPADPLVVYFDNPFPESIMSRVLENLERSHHREPRAIVAVYQQQRYESAETATGNIALLDYAPFLTGRDVRFPLRHRPFLRSFVVRSYRSPEADRSGSRRGSA